MKQSVICFLFCCYLVGCVFASHCNIEHRQCLDTCKSLYWGTTTPWDRCQKECNSAGQKCLNQEKENSNPSPPSLPSPSPPRPSPPSTNSPTFTNYLIDFNHTSCGSSFVVTTCDCFENSMCDSVREQLFILVEGQECTFTTDQGEKNRLDDPAFPVYRTAKSPYQNSEHVWFFHKGLGDWSFRLKSASCEWAFDHSGTLIEPEWGKCVQPWTFEISREIFDLIQFGMNCSGQQREKSSSRNSCLSWENPLFLFVLAVTFL